MKVFDSQGREKLAGAGGAADGLNRISAGTQIAATLATVVFSNSNNVTFGMTNSSQVTASVTVASTQGSINLSAGTTSNLASAFTFSNSNAFTFGLNASTITASYTVPVQSNGILDVSTATASGTATSRFAMHDHQHRGVRGIAAVGTASTFFGDFNLSGGNGVTLITGGNSTLGSVGFSVANQSNQQMTMFATGNTTLSSTGTTNASSLIFRGSNNVSVGITNGSVLIDATTAASGTVLTAYATSNTTQSSTGTLPMSSMIFAGAGIASVGVSNGSVVISVPAGGGGGDGGVFAGVSTFGNTAGSTGTVSTGNFVLVGSNGITLSQSTGAAGSAATVTIAGYAPLSSYDAYFAPGASTLTNNLGIAQTSNNISVYPFTVNAPVSAGIMNMVFSASFTTVGTSSGRQTAGFAMAIYTRNASTLSSLVSNSFSWQVTGNNSSYTINQVTQTNYTGYGATGATNSAGVNITSGYTGGKLVGFPINSLLTPGVYWLGIIATGSTSSVNVGMSLSYQGAVINSQASALAPIGSFSTAYSTGQDPAGGRWQLGHGQWSSAGSVTMVPVSMNLASVSAGGNSVFPFIRFWST